MRVPVSESSRRLSGDMLCFDRRRSPDRGGRGLGEDTFAHRGGVIQEETMTDLPTVERSLDGMMQEFALALGHNDFLPH